MSVEMDANEAVESATMHYSQTAQRGLQQCERHKGGYNSERWHREVAVVREAGSCCSNTEAIEGALDSDKESFKIESVSSLIGMSVVGWISYLFLSN